MIQSNGASQILLAGGSEASLFGAKVIQTAPAALPGNFAIQAVQSSKLLLMQGASVEGGTVAGGVLASSSSSLAMIGSSIVNNRASSPAFEASGSSNVLLSGGNTVTNGAANGIAVEIDHSSSLMQTVIGAGRRNSPARQTPGPAADTVTGAGLIQEQSSIDLGIGLVDGIAGPHGTAPSVLGRTPRSACPAGFQSVAASRWPGSNGSSMGQTAEKQRLGRGQLPLDLRAGIPFRGRRRFRRPRCSHPASERDPQRVPAILRRRTGYPALGLSFRDAELMQVPQGLSAPGRREKRGPNAPRTGCSRASVRDMKRRGRSRFQPRSRPSAP